MKTITRSILALAVFATTLLGAPTRQWSQGDPSVDEQYALEVVNAYRADPVGTIKRYLDLRYKDSKIMAIIKGSPFADPGNVETSVTAILRNAQNELDSAKQTQTSVPGSPGSATGFSQAPFALYPLFSSRAIYCRDNFGYTSAGDIVNVDLTSYNPATKIIPVPKASTPRLEFGYSGPNATGGTAVFNTTGSQDYNGIEYQYYIYDPAVITPRECILNFIQNNIFQAAATFIPAQNKWGSSRMIGVNLSNRVSAIKNGATMLTYYVADSESLKTSDLPFAGDTVFITGVIYKDLNANGEYDPGEGIGGLTVTPSQGDYYAVTSTSGGYSIPARVGTGGVTLAVSGFTSKTVSIGSDNVKVDFVKPADKPTQVFVPGPDGDVQIKALSTRGLAKKGADALIGGLIVTGDAGITKRVVIRVLAATLANAGINRPLQYPKLEIYSNGVLLKSAVPNDCWDTATRDYKVELKNAFTAVGLGQFDQNQHNQLWNPDISKYYSAPGSGDVAVVMDLAPGGYSCMVTPNDQDPTYAGVFNGGVVLLEIYDMAMTNGRLTALSTRGRLDVSPIYGGNEAQMIVGVVTTGSGNARLIVRGGGPALTNLGVPDVLDDTSITLYGANNAVLDSNDDWGKSTSTDQLRSLASAIGLSAYSEGSLDAALLERLPSGLYSAVVSPRGAKSSGVAMVEVYETPKD